MTDSLEETVAEVINDLYEIEEQIKGGGEWPENHSVPGLRRKLERAVREGS